MSSLRKQHFNRSNIVRNNTVISPQIILATTQPRKLQCGMFSVAPQNATIENAHRRSAAFGLSQDALPDFSLIGQSDLSLLLGRNSVLITHALPLMETLHAQIINTHSMVILSDVNGVILHTLGDDDFLEKADPIALKPGVVWSEESKGTNAIGTAIFDQLPTQVHAAEHYLQANHFLTCAAAPIFDYQGNVIGALGVAGDQCNFHKHTMALVRMSAQMIENQLFSAAFQDTSTLHFNVRPELIGTLMEGVVAFSPGGRFLSANRLGLSQLGLPLSALKSHTLGSLLGLPVSVLHEHYRTAAPGLLNLSLPGGVHLYGRAKLHLSCGAPHASIASDACDEGPRAVVTFSAESSRRQEARAASCLRFLNTGDPQVAAVVDKVNKVLGHDIPILIVGETGTGKELLAKAIHNDSSRTLGPFVAVNCASIPETLIESELFGYEDGAFTGARKKGGIGKILQADGGTLFLDEIGDMPFSLQARLLRVLQERMVTPLGSTKSIPVNLELICATNRNLREMIAKGSFREDLYYRLNGLVVKLPPLRERTDLEIIVNRILATESPEIRYTVSPEIMKLFKQHNWPGNFRQMTNLLRTAMVMVDADHEIGVRHMPDDFIVDIEMTREHDSTDITDRLIATGANLEEVELSAIMKALELNNGNVSATARALGVSRNTIYRKR